MLDPSGRRRPALLPSAVFLSGVAVGHAFPLVWGRAAVVGAGAVLLVAFVFRKRTSVLLVVLSSCALGAGGVALSLDDRVSRELRAKSLFGIDGAPFELHLEGRLLSVPESTADGERILLLRGKPANSTPLPGGLLTVRLIVRSSPTDPTRLLDALGTGDRVRVWCRLFRPRGAANPRSGDPAVSLAARGLDALGTVKSARLVEPLGPGGGVRNGIDRLKRFARGRLTRVFDDGERRALAAAMLLGDRGSLAPFTVRRLRGAGLIHLVAISGLHVGILGVALIGSLHRTRLPAVARVLLAGLALYGFGHLVGLRPSVVRAAAAVAALQTGRAIGRDGDALNALAIIAAGLVACAPAALFDPGLQLTFLATAGILLCARSLQPSEVLPRPVAAGVAVSTSAYLATSPLSAWHFGRLAPVCLVTNLAAVPLCCAILAGGYTSIIALDLPWIGPLAVQVARSSTALLLWLADVAAVFDAGSFVVPRPEPTAPLLFYTGAIVLSPAAGIPVRSLRRPLLLGFCLCTLWIHTGSPPPPPPALIEAAVIDVGQGQAVAVRGPRGGSVLVDAAGSPSPRFDPGERIVLPFLLDAVGRRIESLVISHDHLDHAGGARAIVWNLEIGELCLPPGYHLSGSLGTLATLARDQGTSIRLCERGQRFERSGLPVRILGPGRNDGPLSVNDRSVSVLLGVAPHRLLIPGDLGGAGERSLLDSTLTFEAEALLLSHHGSRTGTSSEFLSRVDPVLAIVSCGYGNRFGHPHPSVCRRVRRSGMVLWRTDLDGMVRLRAVGDAWAASATRRARSGEPE
jgi:competence protein ComEC